MTLTNTPSRVVAISASESPDMPVLGLSDQHLREALAEIAIQLLAWGANLAYGGDLRPHGFAELLFELVMRYRSQDGTGSRVTDYLAWPVHIRMPTDDLDALDAELRGFAHLALIGRDGARMSMEDRRALPSREPSDDDWSVGLTSMRRVMRDDTDTRVVLGGRVDGYKGEIPGIAEEALLSLKSSQPVYLIGGFGGCTRDIAETLGIIDTWVGSRQTWPGRQHFEYFGPGNLRNGLSNEENRVLAYTPHIDQAVTLVLRGINRLRDDVSTDMS